MWKSLKCWPVLVALLVAVGVVAVAVGLVCLQPGSDWRSKRYMAIPRLIRASRDGQSASWGEPLTSLSLVELNIAEAYCKHHCDSRAYLLLVALKRQDVARYKHLTARVRASILCANLATSNSLNDWGSLAPEQCYDNFAAHMLLDTGQEALEFLLPLMDDRSPAGLSGSEESTMSIMYGYRRADFACRYAALLLSREPVFALDISKRDSETQNIKRLVKELLAAKGKKN